MAAALQLAFRFASAEDTAAVVALVESAYRGESSKAGWTTEADLLGGQRTDAAMVEGTITAYGSHVLLATDGDSGELLACCELHEPPHRLGAGTLAGVPQSENPEHTAGDAMTRPPGGDWTPGAAYFGMFAVVPTLQGGGVGRRVLEEAERIAREEWKAGLMEMTVLEQRTELVDWYLRRGYLHTRVRKPFPYGDARFGEPRRDDLEMIVLVKHL